MKRQKSLVDQNQSSDLEGHLTHPPYLTFRLSMDKVRYTSLQFKIWEDKLYKIEKQQHQVHLDQIHLNLLRKNSGEINVTDESTERKNYVNPTSKDSFFRMPDIAGNVKKDSDLAKNNHDHPYPVKKESSMMKKKTFVQQETKK